MPPKVSYYVTRPSVDAPPGAMSGNPDPTRLNPHELRIKPPDDRDRRRQKANEESGLVNFLEIYGIPTNHERFYASKGSTALTASNVRLADLQRYYKWEFYSGLMQSGNLSLKALENLQRIKPLYSIDNRSVLLLQLPKDWKKPQGTQTPGTLTVLKAQLDILPEKVRGYYKYSDRNEINGIAYPNPNVTLHETRKDDPKAALRIEWTMLKILAFPRLDIYGSELAVERHIGSNIAGFFNISNCTTSSNTDIAFPTAIGCFGSFPRPDFACRLNDIRSSGNTIPSSFRPVVLAGEAKKDNTRNLPVDDASHYRMAAQLACTVQPTLVLMITDAMYNWEQERKTNVKAPFRFPLHTIIHGIAYDRNGVLIYGFFPRLIAVQNGRPSEWGFGCTVVSTEFTAVFLENSPDRMRFIAAMLIIQRHATYLSEKLQSLSLNKCYANCDKLWRDENGSAAIESASV